MAKDELGRPDSSLCMFLDRDRRAVILNSDCFADETSMKWATVLSIVSSLMVQSALYLQVGHIIVHFDKKIHG